MTAPSRRHGHAGPAGGPGHVAGYETIEGLAGALQRGNQGESHPLLHSLDSGLGNLQRRTRCAPGAITPSPWMAGGPGDTGLVGNPATPRCAACWREGNPVARECVNEYSGDVGRQTAAAAGPGGFSCGSCPTIYPAHQAAAFEAEGREPEEALAGRGGRDGGAGGGGPGAGPPSSCPRWGLAITVAPSLPRACCSSSSPPGSWGTPRTSSHFRRQVLGVPPAAGGYGPSVFRLSLLRREMGLGGGAAPSRRVLSRHSTSPLLLLSGYQLALYSTLLLPVPYAALVASLRGKAACRRSAGRRPGAPPLRLARVPVPPPAGPARPVRRRHPGGRGAGGRVEAVVESAGAGPALTILPLPSCGTCSWRIDAFLGADLFYATAHALPFCRLLLGAPAGGGGPGPGAGVRLPPG